MASLNHGQLDKSPIAPLKHGAFERSVSVFRGMIEPTEAAAERYHLYVSYACPWAHRTLIVRGLKKLDQLVSVSVANPYMDEKGWSFGSGHDLDYLSAVYIGADSDYTGKITVPVLWDNRRETIINNESADIIRIFNSAFDHITGSQLDLYPLELRASIDEMNEVIYEDVNNGVYKAGFAGDQRTYEEAFQALFARLDQLEDLLSRQPFLVGKWITEADIRLFTTLFRFDLVYYVHFKCNYKLLREYPHLQNYLKCLYQIPEIKATCHVDHIKQHYYLSHRWLNRQKIIPLGPSLDLDTPHGRGPALFYNRHTL